MFVKLNKMQWSERQFFICALAKVFGWAICVSRYNLLSGDNVSCHDAFYYL
jgi:hypothetical protein